MKEHPMPTKWCLGRRKGGFYVVVRGVCLMEVASAPRAMHPGKICTPIGMRVRYMSICLKGVSSFLFACFISCLTEKQPINAVTVNVHGHTSAAINWTFTKQQNTWVSDIVYLLLSFSIEKLVERKRQCDVCNQTFSRPQHLKRHIRGGYCTRNRSNT